MGPDDVLRAWFNLIDWVIDPLFKEGLEGVVLIPLSSYTNAAVFICQSTFLSDDFMQRKVAAVLAGYIQEPPMNLLSEMFLSEAARDAALPKDSIDRLYCQSVVEDIVFAATRWCRSEATKANGLALLHQIVERNIQGEYWNTSSYAMTTLIRYNAPDAQLLLDAFLRFAQMAQIDHPSRPSLNQEREFAQQLQNRNPATLNAIESLLDDKLVASQQVRLGENVQQHLNQLIDAAQRFSM